MFKFSQQEKYVILILVSIILIGGGIFYFYNYNQEPYIEKSDKIYSEKKTESHLPTPEEGEIIIHISGAVKNPSVYKLKSGARIFDAVNAAGGYSNEADIDKINLVANIKDGEKIHIPYKAQTQQRNLANNEYSANLININTATEGELCNLPGIGPSLSKRIIEYRSTHPFSSIEEIKDVKGIGEKKFENIKNLITVN